MSPVPCCQTSSASGTAAGARVRTDGVDDDACNDEVHGDGDSERDEEATSKHPGFVDPATNNVSLNKERKKDPAANT
jgi:hypothetical protein